MYRTAKCHNRLANAIRGTLWTGNQHSSHPRRVALCPQPLCSARAISHSIPKSSNTDSDVTSSIQEYFPDDSDEAGPTLSYLRSIKPNKPTILSRHTPNDTFRLHSKYYEQARMTLHKSFTKDQLAQLCSELKNEDPTLQLPGYNSESKSLMIAYLLEHLWKISNPEKKDMADDTGVLDSRDFEFTEAEIEIFTRQENTHLSELIRQCKLDATIKDSKTLSISGSNTSLSVFNKELSRLQKNVRSCFVNLTKFKDPLPSFLLKTISKQCNSHIKHNDTPNYDVTYFEPPNTKNNVRNMLLKAHILQNDRLHAPIFIEPSTSMDTLESVQKALTFLPCSTPSRPEWWQKDITDFGLPFRRVVLDSESHQGHGSEPLLVSKNDENSTSRSTLEKFLKSDGNNTGKTPSSTNIIASFGLGVFDPSLIERLIKVRIFTEEDLASCISESSSFRPMWLPFSPYGFVKTADEFDNVTIRRSIYRPINPLQNPNQYFIQEHEVATAMDGSFHVKSKAKGTRRLVTQKCVNVLMPGRSCDLQFIYQKSDSVKKSSIVLPKTKHVSSSSTASDIIDIDGVRYILARDLYVRRMEIDSKKEMALSRVAEEIHPEPHSSARPYTTSQIIAPGIEHFASLYKSVLKVCEDADKFKLYA